jgi:hypothetical protein
MRQAALARPHSQFAVPTLGLLFRSYWLGMTRLPLIIAALVCLAIVGRRIGAASRNDDASLDDRTAAGEARRRSMLFLAGALGAVPLLGFIVSHFGISIFQDRYMLPSVLGVSILLSHLAWVALSRTTMPAFAMPSMSTGWRLPITYRVGWVALAGWLLLNPIVAALGQKAEIRPGAELEGAMLQEGVMDLPVVSEDQLTMLPLRHYTHIPHDSLFLVTDWQVASDPRSPLRATVHMKVQELWHRLGLSPSVVGTSAFLCAHRRFVVVNEQRFFWFERRVQHDPAFEWHKIGSETTPIRADIILVQRRPDVPSPDCQ